jgi:Fic family protein
MPLATAYKGHDVLVQALALHYHIGAMHPFGDGNGRTARAVEAFFLQKAGLKDQLFIALSNYYYDEKTSYLRALSDAHIDDHDLTPFLKFGLTGVRKQCERLAREINENIRKALFRDVARDLFGRLQSSRKRVLAKRQLMITNMLLEDSDTQEIFALYDRVQAEYAHLKAPLDAYFRDISNLSRLGAIRLTRVKETRGLLVQINTDWPTTITETEFFKSLENLPKAKTYKFLQKEAEQ